VHCARPGRRGTARDACIRSFGCAEDDAKGRRPAALTRHVTLLSAPGPAGSGACSPRQRAREGDRRPRRRAGAGGEAAPQAEARPPPRRAGLLTTWSVSLRCPCLARSARRTQPAGGRVRVAGARREWPAGGFNHRHRPTARRRIPGFEPARRAADWRVTPTLDIGAGRMQPNGTDGLAILGSRRAEVVENYLALLGGLGKSLDPKTKQLILLALQTTQGFCTRAPAPRPARTRLRRVGRRGDRRHRHGAPDRGAHPCHRSALRRRGSRGRRPPSRRPSPNRHRSERTGRYASPCTAPSTTP
jgi:hypothetical protein